MDDTGTEHTESVIYALQREFGSYEAVADHLEISSAHISNFLNRRRKSYPTLIKALRKKGYLEQMPKRIRTEITWESEEQRDALLRHAQFIGLETIQSMFRLLADRLVEIEGMSAAEFIDLHEHGYSSTIDATIK